MSIHEFTGLAYDFRRYNCWHHVANVRRSNGIDTPEFHAVSLADVDNAFASGHADTKGLVMQSEPLNFDAVLMGCRRGNRVIWHAGVYFDGMISHCDRAAGQVKLESLEEIKEIYQEIEFWR